MSLKQFRFPLIVLLLLATGGLLAAAEYDFFELSEFPGERRPYVELDKVTQEGGSEVPDGYLRRTVQWWPKVGVDVMEIPAGAPLRTWTINQTPKKPQWWPILLRGKKQFKAHLLGIRGIGAKINPWNQKGDYPMLTPSVVLRLENGQKRTFSRGSFIEADNAYICDIYEREMKKLRDNTFEEGITWTVNPRHNADFPMGKLYTPGTTQLHTKHFVALMGSEDPEDKQGSLFLINKDKAGAKRNREGIMRGWENWWAYLENAGHLMPYWERPGEKYKYAIQIGGTKRNGNKILGRGNGGSYGGMTVANGNWWGIYHEWTHGQLCGGMVSLGGGETMCDSAQIVGDPIDAHKMMFQVVKPYKNLFWGAYPGAYGWTAVSENPNWGYAAVEVLPPMMTTLENTPMHVIARLGEKRGIWKNGIRGMGDMMGQIGAKMAEFDTEMQAHLRRDFCMPTRTALRTLDAKKRIYRSPIVDAPQPFGVNIVRLIPDAGAKEITVDFKGHYDAKTFSDWRACIVTVEADGRCRYSKLWNKGTMTMKTQPGDRRYWLTVTATPYALSPGHPRGDDTAWTIYQGGFAYRYPYDVQLTGAVAGTPHTTPAEDDMIGQPGGVYGMRNGEGYSVASTPPTPGQPGFEQATGAHQQNGKGKRHPNGGGWVADSATVAETAYVAPGAMVLDGAKVLDNARVNDYAIIMGKKTVLSGNARVYGKTIVRDKEGMREYSGNARIYRRDEKNEDIELDHPQQREAQKQKQRFSNREIRLLANYEMNQAEQALLEDHFQERSTDIFYYGAHRADCLAFDGMLVGEPGFASDGDDGVFTFNGKTQWAELPGEVGDLGEGTYDIKFRATATHGTHTLWAFGTTGGKAISLSIVNGRLVLKQDKSITGGNVTANTWTTVRVEINGDKATLIQDGKTVASGSSISAADAFTPGEPRLGTLAAGLGGRAPFDGAIAHFRIFSKVYEDFAMAEVPLISSRRIPAGFDAKFTAAFPDYEKQLAEAEVLAKGHAITNFYRKYNAAVEDRILELQRTPSPRTAAVQKKVDTRIEEIRRLNRKKRDGRKNAKEFHAKQQAVNKARGDLWKKRQEIFEKDPRHIALKKAEADHRKKFDPIRSKAYQELPKTNAEYIAMEKRRQEIGKLYRDAPQVEKQALGHQNAVLGRKMEGMRNEYIRSIPGGADLLLQDMMLRKKKISLDLELRNIPEAKALQEQAESIRSPEYKADPAIEKRMAAIKRELAALRGELAKAQELVAIEENSAEYRALKSTRYFGRSFAWTFPKVIVARVPMPTDDIKQLREAYEFQSKPWSTTVDWDGRASYELNPDSVKQPVMQHFLKRVKPWMYK